MLLHSRLPLCDEAGDVADNHKKPKRRMDHDSLGHPLSIGRKAQRKAHGRLKR